MIASCNIADTDIDRAVIIKVDTWRILLVLFYIISRVSQHLVLITKHNGVLESPIANRTKVSAGMLGAEVRPMALVTVVVLESKDPSVALAHQAVPQNLNAVV
jgi:hypothetical protein